MPNISKLSKIQTSLRELFKGESESLLNQSIGLWIINLEWKDANLRGFGNLGGLVSIKIRTVL
jgi:hypothetical protein